MPQTSNNSQKRVYVAGHRGIVGFAIVRVLNQTVTNCHGLKMQAALLKQHGYSVNVSVE